MIYSLNQNKINEFLIYEYIFTWFTQSQGFDKADLLSWLSEAIERGEPMKSEDETSLDKNSAVTQSIQFNKYFKRIARSLHSLCYFCCCCCCPS